MARAVRATPMRGRIKKVVRKRNRRSPNQLIQDLRSKREELATQMAERLRKYDEKLDQLEARYGHRIAVQELAETSSAEELQRQLQEAKRQQRLLQMALKHKA